MSAPLSPEDSALVAEEAGMNGDVATSHSDPRSLFQSANVTSESSLRTAISQFNPSHGSEIVLALSALRNNRHATSEMIEYTIDAFTGGGVRELNLLIHNACYIDEQVAFLIDKYPSAVEYLEDYEYDGVTHGQTSHLLMELFTPAVISDNVALVVWDKLLDQHREFLCHVRMIYGFTPLHMTAIHKTARSTDFCRNLLQTLPELLSAQDVQGLRPFERACATGNRDVIALILESNPTVVVEHNLTDSGPPVLFGVLFLEVFDDNVALFVLDNLLRSSEPEIVRNAKSSDGHNLLQYAAVANDIATGRIVEICSAVIYAFPSFLYEQDLHGLTPLHNACNELNLTFAKCVMDNCPEVFHERSSRGITPITYIFTEQNLTENPNETIEFTRYLLEVDPSVASDLRRSTYPLTHVCMLTEEPYLNAGLEVIKLLYNAYPQVLIIQELVVRRLIENERIINAVAS